MIGETEFDLSELSELTEDAEIALKNKPATQLDILQSREMMRKMSTQFHEATSRLEDKVDRVIEMGTHPPETCPGLDAQEKIKLLEVSMKDLSNKMDLNSKAMCRNGHGALKVERQIPEVIQEIHEAIYLFKVPAIFLMKLYDFGREHKWWATIMVTIAWVYHDKLFGTVLTLLNAPSKIPDIVWNLIKNFK
jgi:hypothetical protein